MIDYSIDDIVKLINIIRSSRMIFVDKNKGYRALLITNFIIYDLMQYNVTREFIFFTLRANNVSKLEWRLRRNGKKRRLVRKNQKRKIKNEKSRK